MTVTEQNYIPYIHWVLIKDAVSSPVSTLNGGFFIFIFVYFELGISS